MYQILRKSLFLLDAEKAHYLSMNLLKAACRVKPLQVGLRQYFQPPSTGKNHSCFGLEFKNPVGLGAGFDKNASYLEALETLGFGFVEIGTVTPLPQAGNDKPRLFRLPQDKAIINRMGFNNDGVEKIRGRLEAWKKKDSSLIIGGNIGKNKITPNEEAWKDYEICFNRLFDVVDYFVVNVSSPNTPGLRELQEKDSLLKILGTLQENNKRRQQPKPLLLKIAPDLTDGQLKDIAEIAQVVKLDGLVSSNTTLDRSKLSESSKSLAERIGMGGLSGKPLKTGSDLILQKLITFTNGEIPVIASGGIFTGQDALDKIKLGASLVQVWTGFIYEGPMIVKNICKKLNTI